MLFMVPVILIFFMKPEMLFKISSSNNKSASVTHQMILK